MRSAPDVIHRLAKNDWEYAAVKISTAFLVQSTISGVPTATASPIDGFFSFFYSLFNQVFQGRGRKPHLAYFQLRDFYVTNEKHFTPIKKTLAPRGILKFYVPLP